MAFLSDFLGQNEGRSFIPKKKVGSISYWSRSSFMGRNSVHIQAGLINVQSIIKDQVMLNQSSHFDISYYLFSV